ncbi:hypothetical protein F4556_004865 [Kitasatospora gansuensis]|uniref:Uncharacterized protein n=1 Tax=Kitasatospora gansuensis TaxID=258050 RepID=A0A7W7SF55_9ACTN|nr:hypothetical protein [Kitasatospora gansuensis]MBB4949330.1 hypothetical protein [Kitasatospora gansuensis]
MSHQLPAPTDTGPVFPGLPTPLPYGPPPRATARPRRRRPLLWGVLSALLTSAVWAVAVLTVPGIVVLPDGPAPEIGDYRVVEDLCATAKLSRFTQLYPAQSGTPYHYSTRHAALDDMYCSKYLKKSAGETEYSSLYMQAQLHRKVNPRAEFDAQQSGLRQRKYLITEVPDLGDQAYVGYLDDRSSSDRTWHYLTQVLYVRDGGLTYYLSWSGSYQEGKAVAPDRETVRQALLMDSRDVLRALAGL